MPLKNLKAGVFDQFQVVSDTATVEFPEQGTKTVFITKGSACAITVTAPVTPLNDNCRLVFIAVTAHAHTVTLSTLGFNAGDAAKDVGTFGGAIGDGFEVVAYNGEAYTTNVVNVTLG